MGLTQLMAQLGGYSGQIARPFVWTTIWGISWYVTMYVTRVFYPLPDWAFYPISFIVPTAILVGWWFPRMGSPIIRFRDRLWYLLAIGIYVLGLVLFIRSSLNANWIAFALFGPGLYCFALDAAFIRWFNPRTTLAGAYQAHFAALAEVQSLVLPKGPSQSDVLSLFLATMEVDVKLRGLARLNFFRSGLFRRVKPEPPFEEHLLGVVSGQGGRRELGHMLVVGPNRSGKGLHLTTNLLQWPSSVIVNDIKGELYRLTGAYRSRFSKVILLDPDGFGSRYDPFADLAWRVDPSDPNNPNARVINEQALMTAAELIVQSQSDGPNAYFGQRAAAGLSAAIHAALLEAQPVVPFLAGLVESGDIGTFARGLARFTEPAIRRNLGVFLGRSPESLSEATIANDKALSGAWTTLLTRLRPFLSDGVRRMTSGTDFSARDLQCEPITVYLRFREADRALRPVYQLISLALLNTVLLQADTALEVPHDLPQAGETQAGMTQTGMAQPEGQPTRQPTLPLLVALDEAGVTPIPELPRLVSTAAGRGVSLMIYVQSLSQLEGDPETGTGYGRSGAETIIGNCQTKLFYRPEDLRTAQYLERSLGKMSFDDWSSSSSVSSSPEGGDSQTSGVSVRSSNRELVTVDELRGMHPEKVIVLASELPPVLAVRLKPQGFLWAEAEMAVAPLPAPLIKLEGEVGFQGQVSLEGQAKEAVNSVAELPVETPAELPAELPIDSASTPQPEPVTNPVSNNASGKRTNVTYYEID
jgi:type IV secretion system protein VirD4